MLWTVFQTNTHSWKTAGFSCCSYSFPCRSDNTELLQNGLESNQTKPVQDLVHLRAPSWEDFFFSPSVNVLLTVAFSRDIVLVVNQSVTDEGAAVLAVQLVFIPRLTLGQLTGWAFWTQCWNSIHEAFSGDSLSLELDFVCHALSFYLACRHHQTYRGELVPPGTWTLLILFLSLASILENSALFMY